MASDPFPPDLPTSLYGLLSLIFGGLMTAVALLWRRVTELTDRLFARDKEASEDKQRLAAALERQTEIVREAIRRDKS